MLFWVNVYYRVLRSIDAVSYTHLFLTVYVDDILIASRTFTEHLEHIEYVLDKLHKGGLTVNWDKSKFLQTEIHFLGFKMCIRDR